jgi:tetratricopeptide (TPR) repeat protein
MSWSNFGMSLTQTEVWPERVAKLIRRGGPKVMVHCRKDSGIVYALERLNDPDAPAICVWLDQPVDNVALGDALSEAVASALGSPLFGKNVPYQYGFAVLRRHIGLLSPLRFILGWVPNCIDAARELIHIVRPPNSLVLVTNKPTILHEVPGFTHIRAEELALTTDEAILEASGALSLEKVTALLEQTEGAYGAFRETLYQALGLTQVARPLQRFTSEESLVTQTSRIEDQIRAYCNRDRWIEAFSLTCEYDHENIEQVIDKAANQLFDLGQCDYLWTKLNRLPPDIRRRPLVAYWLLAAATATNRQDLLTQLVTDVLREHSAPLLRATAAVLRISHTSLAETRTALDAEVSPVTLRAHAFALANHGYREEPLRYFRRALNLAGRAGTNHLVIASAVDISNQEICLGRYRNGAEWARWALNEYAARGLGEELRRMAALASLAFASLLAGELARESGLIEGLVIPDSAIGIPGTEGSLSTLADLALVRGDFVGAERIYRRNFEASPLEGNAFAALDLVRFLLTVNRDQEAHAIAEMSWAISQTATPQEAAFSELSRGMVAAYRGLPQAEEILSAALHGLSHTSFVLQETLASVWLAMFLQESGRRPEARAALEAAHDGLKELGPSGWRWMGSANERIDSVRRLWSQPTVKCEMKFLGRSMVRVNSCEVPMRLRYCEVLAILAQYQEGISPQKLALYQYGDHGSPATAKSNISHLRKHVSISESPYKLRDESRADFVQLMDHLEKGELQAALNLYDGQLLPASSAPAIVELRDHIDAALRSAVIAARDPDSLIQLATAFEDDLELWECARDNLTAQDHRRPLINARIRRVQESWGS